MSKEEYVTPDPENEIRKGLMRKADDARGIQVAVLVVLNKRDEMEVYAWGEPEPHGARVDKMLDWAKQEILKPEYRRDRS